MQLNGPDEDTGKLYTFDRVFRLFLGACVLVGLIWLTSYLQDVLLPFAVALVLAYLLNPLVLLIQKAVKKRWLAVLLCLVTVGLILVLLWILLVPAVVDEVRSMGKMVKALVTNSEIAQRANQQLPEDLWEAIRYLAGRPDVQAVFKFTGAGDMLASLAKKILPGLWGLLIAAGSFVLGLLGLFIIVLYMVFLMLDFPAVQEGWPNLIPPKYRNQVMGFTDDAENALATYFRGQAAVAALVGVLFAICFFIISLPMGIVLGLFIGLLNMVPYLQLIALIPAFFLAALHTLETGADFWSYMALTGGVFVVVQLIQDAVLVPRIMGKATGLSPAIIMLSLSIWGKLLGFLGLLLAIPLTVLGWAYYNRYVCGPKKHQQADAGCDAEP